jgi:hypothetical protein
LEKIPKKRMRLRSCTEGKQNENEVKQKRDCEAATKLMTLSHSFSFCFVTSEVDKSNFYKDLERVIEWEDSISNQSKNHISSNQQ